MGEGSNSKQGKHDWTPPPPPPPQPDEKHTLRPRTASTSTSTSNVPSRPPCDQLQPWHLHHLLPLPPIFLSRSGDPANISPISAALPSSNIASIELLSTIHSRPCKINPSIHPLPIPGRSPSRASQDPRPFRCGHTADAARETTGRRLQRFTRNLNQIRRTGHQHLSSPSPPTNKCMTSLLASHSHENPKREELIILVEHSARL